MKTKPLGATKLKVSEFGLSCEGVDEEQSLLELQRAEALGVNFFDAACHETLFAKAFKKKWNDIILATQCDARHCHHPDELKTACDASLQCLGVNVIDLYYVHGLNDVTLVEETMMAMRDLIEAGKIRYLGLSNVDITLLQQAHLIHPITAFKSSYASFSADAQTLMPLCEAEHISLVLTQLHDKLPAVILESPTIIPILEHINE